MPATFLDPMAVAKAMHLLPPPDHYVRHSHDQIIPAITATPGHSTVPIDTPSNRTIP